MSGKVSSYFKQQKPTAARQNSKKIQQQQEPAEPSLGVHGEAAVNDLELSEEQRLLRSFDLTSKFGPCTGMTRLERWERAERFGLDPPMEVKRILLQQGVDSSVNNNIWSNRV